MNTVGVRMATMTVTLKMALIMKTIAHLNNGTHPYGYKAAVLMAESSLQNAGKTIATADRYQVIVSVDASELSDTQIRHGSDDTYSCTSTNHNIIPTKRPTVRGAGPIARYHQRNTDSESSMHKGRIF